MIGPFFNLTMKSFLLTLVAAVSAGPSLFASITINGEYGKLRNGSGSVIAMSTTLYVIIYDADNNQSLPGGLVVNQSLTGDDSEAAHAAFAGLNLTQGYSIGGDKVVKIGTFNDPDGFAAPVLKTEDFDASGVSATAGFNYGFYWFPGISTTSIPDTLFEVGGINETVDYFGTGSNFIGTVIPADGNTVTTNITDTDLGGEVGETSRFTAITAVPEPSALSLAALSMLGLMVRRRAFIH